jgi:DNA polymerase I-like protein with 3'-5' exonuclease and polymerase domains
MSHDHFCIDSFVRDPPSVVAIDIETDSLSRRCEIISAAIAWREGDKVVSQSFFLSRLPLINSKYSADELRARLRRDEKLFLQVLNATLFSGGGISSEHTSVFHNALFDVIRILERYREPDERERKEKTTGRPNASGKYYRFNSNDFCRISDTAAMSRVHKNNKVTSFIDPKEKGRGPHGLKFLEEELLHISDRPDFQEVTGGRSSKAADLDELLQYNESDAANTLCLYEYFSSNLDTHELSYIYNYDEPHLFNLLHLSWHGTPFDRPLALKGHQEVVEGLQELENQIFELTESIFNLESHPALSSAIFNIGAKFQPAPGVPPLAIRPLFRTPSGSPAVDSQSLRMLFQHLNSIDPYSGSLKLIRRVLRHQEMVKNRSFFEVLLRYAVAEPGLHDKSEYFLFPNMSANAVSGRVICSSPNLLGLPKKFFKQSDVKPGENDELLNSIYNGLKDSSIRKTIRVKDSFELHGIDINGLDLAIIANGARNFSKPGEKFFWMNFLEPHLVDSGDGKVQEKVIDSHFALLQRYNWDEYVRAFANFEDRLTRTSPGGLQDFWAMKPGERDSMKGIEFIHKSNGSSVFLEFPKDNGESEIRIERIREMSKRMNLAASYLIGAPGLAAKLSEVEGGAVSVEVAEAVLHNFYRAFPEIRAFQDDVANSVYRDGYVRSLFGRKFYADTWDDLNEYFRREQMKDGPNDSLCNYHSIEFILKVGANYWYVQGSGWQKDEGKVIENLRILKRPFGFRLRQISKLVRLDPHTFRPASAETRKRRAKLRKKSESQLEDLLKTELSRIEITFEVEERVHRSSFTSSEADSLIRTWLDHGEFFIPEKDVLYYRTQSRKSPTSKIFKLYTPLLQAAKRFFPMYCQGIASTIAKICLTETRQGIETTRTAVIHLFVHDQMIVSSHESESSVVGSILTRSIGDTESKKPFDIKFRGSLKSGKRSFADVS